MRIEDRIYTGLKQVLWHIVTIDTHLMRIEDRIYTGLKQSLMFIEQIPFSSYEN